MCGYLKSVWLASAVGALLFLAGDRAIAGATERGPVTVDDERPDDVVASVDGQHLFRRQIAQAMSAILGERALDESSRQRLFAEVTEQLIDRLLVLRAIEAEGYKVGPSELKIELEVMRGELARVGRTLEELWHPDRLTESDWQQEVAWRLAWQRYLSDYLSDDRLNDYYQSHRRDFDGTQLRVAQILIAIEEGDGGLDAAVARAEQLRQDLLQGRTAWSAAVTEHSIAPSRQDDGHLGWIERYRPMPAAFSDAAFRLQPGELSDPVVSTFGVHLIQCLEAKPGSFRLGDVRDEVRRAATEARFAELAAAGRAAANIEYAAPRDRR